MKAAAFDLSLRQTGWAVEEDGARHVGTIRPKSLGMVRLAEIRDRVLELAEGADLVLIEHYAFNSGQGAHQLGELGGVVRLALWEAALPFVNVAPACLKKLATGNGIAKKTDVLLAAVRRLDYQGANDNEADALWLLEAGLIHLGLSTITLPKPHLAGLAKIEWPDAVPC